MDNHFQSNMPTEAYLIIDGVRLPLNPVCEGGFSSLSEQLCASVELNICFVCWSIIGQRMTLGPEILQNCLLIER